MGKSCLLLATTQVAARSVYVGGNTSTTTGLTVSLSKEAGGEVGIEAGALVLADQGVCCIDEFDKMTKSNQDGEFSRHATQYIIYTFMVVYHAFTFTFILLRATVNAGLLERWNNNKSQLPRPELWRRYQLVAVL